MIQENENIENKEKKGFTLELGDIIEIVAPTNDILNNQTFYIQFINIQKVDLINVASFQLEHLTIDQGLVTDESITEINLLSRSEEKGYARQKGLIPKKWLDIHFGGEIPTIITGEITNLEEDEIEIRTFPQEETIFINFEYQGIPEDIPIEKIIIRDPPRAALIERMNVEGEEPVVSKENEEATITYTDQGESIIHIPDESTPDENIHEVLQSVYLNANELFGEDLEEIFQIVEIPESEKKYGLDIQVNDFTDELLSTIPNVKRTQSVMNRIHLLVERFKELRQLYSTFDDNGNVIHKKVFGDLYKPLVDHLNQLDVKLRWLLPVVQHKKKIYEGKTLDGLDNSSDRDIFRIENDVDLVHQETIQTNYYKNRVLGEQNDYEYMLRTNQDFMTPFTPPENREEYLLFNKEIKTDLEVIVNNFGDFLSTVSGRLSKSNTDSTKFKYFIQKYNLGTSRVHSVETRNNQKIYIRNKITPNDKITIQSLIMMPEPIIHYSHIDLPSTNILTKTNLGFLNIDFFRLFTKKREIKQKIITDLENEMDHETDNPELLKEITEFVLDDTIGDEDEKYKKFLNVVFPKIRVLIRLMRDSIHNKFSFKHVVQSLEPFMIYPDNISYGQYNEIRFFIKEKIKDYKIKTNELSNEYNLYKNKNYKISDFVNKMYQLLNENSELQELFIETYYDRSKTTESLKTTSSSEILHQMIQTDHTQLYSNLLTTLLLSLITPNKLLDMNEKMNLENVDEYEKIGEKNCIRRFLTKKYNSISELQKDNNTDVLYYDKDYDDTPYSILKKYEDEKKKMLPDKFIGFLAENLVQKHDCPRNMSEELAKTLIAGKKEIKDGEYAVLVMKPSLHKDFDSEKLTEKEKKEIEIEENVKTYYHYYKRLSNNWIRDNEIDEEAFFDNNSLFCNIDFQCKKNASTSTCDSMKSEEIHMKNISARRALNEFEKRFSITVEELTKKLEKDVEYYKLNLKKNKLIRENSMYKSNFISYEMGKYANKDDLIQSPYLKLYDLILSQPDFAKKQMDICRFVNQYCREPMDSVEPKENTHWFYCKETNTFLVPQSIFQLAQTFISGGDYSLKIDELCHQVGEISDDGCSWIDKHCGCELKKIDFVDENEYTESGYKIVTNSIIEKDLGTVANEAFSQSKKAKENKVFEDETTHLTYNVFQAISTNIDIPSETIESFVMRVSMEIIMNSEIVLSEASYMKRADKIEKTKGKVQAPYKTYKNQTIISIVGGVLLIAIQTVIPSFKVKKTFPGCVFSFGGYPMDGGVEDTSGLKYISCVINKLKSPISPWDSIEKLSASIMEKRIKEIMERFMISRNDIIELYLKKKEYLLLNPEMVTLKDNCISKWKHFLPPIVEFHVAENLQGVTHEFNKEFVDVLRKGNKDQHDAVNVYKSKNIIHSYAIVESINQIVKSKELLLKTMAKIPFLENACCNEGGLIHPITYFIQENKNIDLFIKRCQKNQLILKNVKDITEASLLIYNENTMIQYPMIPTEFMEINIYQTFIFYCHFDNDLPIPDDLHLICREKPNGYNKNWSIEEKMEYLKKHGKRYSLGDLNQLMKIIHKRNMAAGPIPQVVNPVLLFKEFVDHLESNHSKVIEEPLRKLLFQLLKEYSPKKMVDENEKEQTPFVKAITKLRNYLIKTNERMYNKIISFIDKNGNLSSKKYDEIQEILLHMMKWELDRSIKESGNYYDDGMYTVTKFMENSIYTMTKVVPQVILNNVSYQSVHAHWGLSNEHMRDIENFVKQHTVELNKYKNNKIIQRVLQNMNLWVDDIVSFLNYIPIQTPIEKEGNLFFSLLDKRTIYLLYTYCWYSVLYEIIESTNDPELLKLDIKESRDGRRTRIQESKDESNYIETVVNNNDTITEYEDEVINVEILSGDKLELQQNVCSLLLDFIYMENKNKKTVDIPYSQISRKTKKTKEAEKKSITDFLQNLEKDERNVENQLKKFKMGRWNIGMQKGVFQYDKNVYNENRDANLARMYEDVEYNELENGESRSLDAADLDALDEQENRDLYDNEGNDISGLGEDYGDGNYYPEDNEED
jgi:hypothetical protein